MPEPSDISLKDLELGQPAPANPPKPQPGSDRIAEHVRSLTSGDSQRGGGTRPLSAESFEIKLEDPPKAKKLPCPRTHGTLGLYALIAREFPLLRFQYFRTVLTTDWPMVPPDDFWDMRITRGLILECADWDFVLVSWPCNSYDPVSIVDIFTKGLGIPEGVVGVMGLGIGLGAGLTVPLPGKVLPVLPDCADLLLKISPGAKGADNKFELGISIKF